MKKFKVKAKQYAPVTPTDTTRYPKQCIGWRLLTFKGTEVWQRSGMSTADKLIVMMNLGGYKAKSANCVMVSSKYPLGGVNTSGVYTTDPTTLFVNLMDGIADLNAWKSYLASEYSAGRPLQVLYPLATSDGSVWKAVKKVATNQFGYLNETTGEFIEAYGMTGTIGEQFDLIPTKTFKVKQSKNLWDENCQYGYPSSITFSNNTKRLFTERTWVKGLAFNNYYQESNCNAEKTNSRIDITYSSAGYGVGFPIKCLPNTTYSLSMDSDMPATNRRILFYDSDGTYIKTIQGSAIYLFTTPENATTLVVLLNANGYCKDIMLNEGSTALPYESYGMSLVPIKEFKVKQSRNLFDISKVISNDSVINNVNGSLTINTPTTQSTNAAAPNTLFDYIPEAKVGVVYTLSFETDGISSIYLSGSAETWTSGASKTMTQEMLNGVVRFYANGKGTSGVTSYNFMINEGSTALPFEPYGKKII